MIENLDPELIAGILIALLARDIYRFLINRYLG